VHLALARAVLGLAVLAAVLDTLFTAAHRSLRFGTTFLREGGL